MSRKSEGAITKSILVASSSFTEALKGLIGQRQESQSGFSLNALGRRLGVKSTGYFSDVLGGRRKLPKKYLEVLNEVFHLDLAEAEYLALLLDLDREKDTEIREEIVDKLQRLSRILGQPVLLLSERIRSSAFALEVYSAFGLFDSKPTLRQLLKFFGRERILDLERAIRVLVNEGMITRKRDSFESVEEKRGVMALKTSDDAKGAPAEYARNALLEAAQATEQWFGRPNEAIVGSSVLSCRADLYPEKLKEFKEIIYKSHLELESSDADMLVRFNIMVYPLGKRTSE